MNPIETTVRNASRKFAYFVLAVIVIGVVFANIRFIDEGERAVVLTFGAFKGRIMEPGLNIKVPFVQSLVTYDVRTQKMEIARSEAYSKDLQPVSINSVVNYRLNASDIGAVYGKYNRDVESKVLLPLLESSIKQIVAKYTAEEIIAKRLELQTAIGEAFKSGAPKELTVEAYQLVNEDFSDKFEQAIEAKQVAQQDAERAEREKVEAQTRAEMTVITAKAQADAIRIQTQAINAQGGQDYVQLKAIEKWNGIMPTYVTAGSSLPFIGVK